MNTMLLQLVVGDEKTETLKEKMKGWVELGGHSSLVYHKKQSLLSNKVPSSFSLLFFHCTLLTRVKTFRDFFDT